MIRAALHGSCGSGAEERGNRREKGRFSPAPGHLSAQGAAVALPRFRRGRRRSSCRGGPCRPPGCRHRSCSASSCRTRGMRPARQRRGGGTAGRVGGYASEPPSPVPRPSLVLDERDWRLFQAQIHPLSRPTLPLPSESISLMMPCALAMLISGSTSFSASMISLTSSSPDPSLQTDSSKAGW